MQTSFVRAVWPRAESSMYTEPKKLVERGFASCRQEQVNNRLRTIYEITDAGRDALKDWLEAPAAAASIEHESMLKLALTDFSSQDLVLERIQEIEQQVQDAHSRKQFIVDGVAKNGFRVPEQSVQAIFGLLSMQHFLRAQELWVVEARNLLKEIPTNKEAEEIYEWAQEKYVSLVTSAERSDE
jgi:DNA-binding PadR family transcriptional regulator